MSGSRTYRTYTADNGDNYVIAVDKSNADASIVGGNGASLLPPRTANFPDLPRGIVPRYILCYPQSNPNIRRKFKVGGVNQINAIYQPGSKITAEVYPGLADLPGVRETWIITAYRGEKRNLRPAFDSAVDTGLSDGNLLVQ